MDISEDTAPEPGLEGFVEEFYQDRTEELESLNQFFSENNYEEIRKLAHKWKGFSTPYGFLGLEVLSRELESHALNKENQKIESCIGKIQEYLLKKAESLNI